MISPETKAKLLEYQRNEITEHHIYRRLAKLQKSEENREVLARMAGDEKRHYEEWKSYTGEEVRPDMGKVRKFYWISRIFGFTFGAKLMERGEESAQETYGQLPAEELDKARAIVEDENAHEQALLDMLDEERLRYVGSIVLGLNDALVELTGALAGLTLALQNTRLIALTGCITGIAAALSMAASEYLSTKTEAGAQSPVKASFYTGTAYIITVALLIFPYLVLSNFYGALGVTLAIAVAIIAAFNYYVAVAKDQPFKRRFAEMAGLSLCVAGISFLIGLGLRVFLGVEA
jgi:VIT1/CCC1 family predicted Fe2+/Mn2+ transporter